MIGNTPLNVLMKQAADLKTHQMASDRKKYDSWPIWYQHTFFLHEEMASLHSIIDIDELVKASNAFRDKGNTFFKNEEYEVAILQYERALAVWEWIETIVSDWRHSAIIDQDLRQRQYSPKSDEEAEVVYNSKLSCLLNLSAAYLKARQWNYCIQACDTAITLPPPNNTQQYTPHPKALYRRAMARILPPSSGTVEQLMALKDLEMAFSLRPKDSQIGTELLLLRQSLARQQQKDKRTFGGLFDRVEDLEGDSNPEETDYPNQDNPNPEQKEEQTISYQHLQHILVELEGAIDRQQSLLTYNTDPDDTRDNHTRLLELQEKRQSIVSLLDSYCLQHMSSKVDYLHPDEETITQAKRHGVDLTDRNTRNTLHKRHVRDTAALQQRLHYPETAAAAAAEGGDDPLRSQFSFSSTMSAEQVALLSSYREEAHALTLQVLGGCGEESQRTMLLTRLQHAINESKHKALASLIRDGRGTKSKSKKSIVSRDGDDDDCNNGKDKLRQKSQHSASLSLQENEGIDQHRVILTQMSPTAIETALQAALEEDFLQAYITFATAKDSNHSPSSAHKQKSSDDKEEEEGERAAWTERLIAVIQLYYTTPDKRELSWSNPSQDHSHVENAARLMQTICTKPWELSCMSVLFIVVVIFWVCMIAMVVRHVWVTEIVQQVTEKDGYVQMNNA